MPPQAGSQSFNYKNRHSIVLLAVCDANHSFSLVDVGAYGSQSDEGVFKNSLFGKALELNDLDIPSSNTLPNSETSFPYYFVGDAAFPLKKYLIRPFPGQNLPPDKVNFNTRISRARVLIENTFRILASRWRVLRNDIPCLPENAKIIVKTTLVLHNFLRKNDNLYCPSNYADQFNGDQVISGLWRNEEFQMGTVKYQNVKKWIAGSFFFKEPIMRLFVCQQRLN